MDDAAPVRKTRCFATLPAALLLAACAAPSYDRGPATTGGPVARTGAEVTYDPGPAGRCELCGTVRDVDRVALRQGRSSGAGAVLGALIGAAAGTQIGEGTGQTLATVAGAAGGAAVGDRIERTRDAGRDQGYRIEVDLDDGRDATVVQLNPYGLQPGDRVRIENEEAVPI